ncbi:MAG TPA: bifunctional phosphoglucose/phosphomannose isomerase [Actinomycetota bacterium]|nr:bifunctional phosphoglucose/phosphomannose isomerase [Actinomycetota bacterium]
MTTRPLVDPGVLDDPARRAALDSSEHLRHLAGLGAQLRRGYAAGRDVERVPSGSDATAVVVCGMGGSGVAADVLRGLYANRVSVPIVASKGYGLPALAGRETIVVAVSFSGNTEETLSAYRDAVGRGCRVIAVSCGGTLADLAAADGVAHVHPRSDVPMPRMAIGDLSAAVVGALEAAGVLPSAEDEVGQAADVLDALAARVAPDRPAGDNVAKDLAVWIGARTPVVWGSEGLAEAPATRFRTQVNENAKSPALSAWLPELDHNEIEGWSSGAGAGYALVVLRHRLEHARIGDRLAATLSAIAPSGLEARELHAEGTRPFEVLFSLVLLADFAATYLALLRGVDPTPIPVLSSLKERLAR